ncbi:MAG TPA: IF-2-associated domain-containing protein, partial [Burkholderiales bacterium]
MPPALLLEQLNAAGVSKKVEDDTLTEADKTQLLDYLRRMHGAKESKSKITLTRKQTAEVKKADATGKARTIQVEVRKKRVLVKREPEPEAPPPPPPAPVIDEEQIRLREEEARQQEELAARQAAEVAEKKTRTRKKAVAEAPQPEEAKPAEAAPATESAAAAAAVPGAAPAAAVATDGTLHRPAPKAGEETKPEKKAKKPAKPVIYADESGHRRTIKTRGDDTAFARARHLKSRTKDDEAPHHAFVAPTEPVKHDVLVPETITV